MATKSDVLSDMEDEQLRHLAAEYNLSDDVEGLDRDETIEVLAQNVTVEQIKQYYRGVIDANETTEDKPNRRQSGGGASADQALVDPEQAAKDRFPGTTSDASTRTEGTVASDVEPDPPSGEAKPTDDENYDFPPQGDVDNATREIVETEDEFVAPLSVEDWVVLDGTHESVPDALDGRRAVVLEAPRALVRTADRDDVQILVRTRDDYNATLSIPLAAVKEIQRRGVSPVR